MGRRDAFGNEIEDDAPDVRAGASPSSAAANASPIGDQADPFGGDASPPPPGDPVPPRPRPRPRRSRARPLTTLRAAFPVAVVAAALWGIPQLVDKASDEFDRAQRAIGTGVNVFSVPSVPRFTAPSPAVPAVPPVGFGKGSLLLKSNFADALRTLRGEGVRVRTLRVAADRIDAQVVTRDGRQSSVQVTWQGKLSVFGTTPPGLPTTGLLVLDTVVRAAPFRLARSAAERAGRPVSSVDYVVALGLGPGQVWSLFFRNGGGHYTGDRSGRITRKVS